MIGGQIGEGQVEGDGRMPNFVELGSCRRNQVWRVAFHFSLGYAKCYFTPVCFNIILTYYCPQNLYLSLSLSLSLFFFFLKRKNIFLINGDVFMGPNDSALNPRNGVQSQQPRTLYSKEVTKKQRGRGDSIFKVVLFYRSKQLGVKSFYRVCTTVFDSGICGSRKKCSFFNHMPPNATIPMHNLTSKWPFPFLDLNFSFFFFFFYKKKINWIFLCVYWANE